MLLTISTTATPATDLGYLLAKNPARVQRFDQGFGSVHVFYPDRRDDLCTACVLVAVDPVGLVKDGNYGSIDQYVNDRPYVASSLLAVTLSKVFKSALSGDCKDRPELAKTAIPLTATISVLPSRRGAEFIRNLFEPLGYKVTLTQHAMDERYPEWGDSWCYTVTLEAVTTLKALMTHLYVLVPVLDNSKHYDVIAADEVQKLLKYASDWLPKHPHRRVIALRYLRYKDKTAEKLLAQMDAALAAAEAPAEAGDDVQADVPFEPTYVEPEPAVSVEAPAPVAVTTGGDPERTLTLHQQRHEAVIAVLKERGVKSVIDLGCGDGKLVVALAQADVFDLVAGTEPIFRGVEVCGYRLHRGCTAEQKAKVQVFQGSLMYADQRTRGFDAAVCVEVIEHLDPERLLAFSQSMFGVSRARTVVVTTPNIEYNMLFPGMQPGQLRHNDHRFEWSRAQFQGWCLDIARRYGYSVQFRGIGEEHPDFGAPSQMAIFNRLLDDDTTVGADGLADLAMLTGDLKVTTALEGELFVRERYTRSAFEETSRFTVDPRLLIYVPPTMSPCSTSILPGTLEHPAEAFGHYRVRGVTHVVAEQKHMGSRAIVIVCRDRDAMQRRFGTSNEAGGVVYTRHGRPFFHDTALEVEFIGLVRRAMERAGTFTQFSTDWVALDAELMPWSAKAQGLLRKQYAPAGAAGVASLGDAVARLTQAQASGLQVDELLGFTRERYQCVGMYREAYRAYCWPVNSVLDYKLAPFHILATEGAVHTNRDHVWHMQTLAGIAAAGDGLVMATPYHVVDVNDPASCAAATEWWEQLTAGGGEGMVVKPLEFTCRRDDKLMQPAIKVRGREYLRIIYGPEYTLAGNLDRLRKRSLGTKRKLAIKEFALGVEALERFVNRRGVTAVHEAAFAVLALESEPVDPRL